MGSEFAQFNEWRDDQELDWMLLDYPKHRELQRMVGDLNRFYTSHPAMYTVDDGWNGFIWLNPDDDIHSTLSWIRSDANDEQIVCIFNFTPVAQENYYIGLPEYGTLEEVFSTDAPYYGGTGAFGNKTIIAEPREEKGFPFTAKLRMPPYGGVYFKYRVRKPSDN